MEHIQHKSDSHSFDFKRFAELKAKQRKLNLLYEMREHKCNK